MFIAALFTIASTWKQLRCPSTDKWIRRLWYIYIVWNTAAAAAAKSLQSCPTLCDPIDSRDSPGKNTGVGCHFLLQCMKVKSESEVAQSCPTLSDPMDCSPPGSAVHGIFQARVLEWSAIAFSHDNPRQHIKKQRHYFPDKGLSSQGYGFSSSHVWM